MSDRTIPELLADRAQTHPDRPFLRFADGDITFAELAAWSGGLAEHFRSLGIGRGDLVPVMMPNRAEFVAAWFALAELGAVTTMINTAMRGPALAHALALSGSGIAVVDPMFTDTPELEPFRLVDLPDRLDLDRSPASRAVAVHPHDPAMIMFTSGTTGRSKGCVLSHRYAVRQAELMVEHLELRPDDVLYCPFPLFHLDGSVLTVMPALVLGTTAAIGERFSATGFWPEIRRFDATVFDFMGATLTMLHKAPTRADDADNPARLAWGVPVPEFADEFETRFGLRLVELYGSTDAGLPIYQPLDEPRRPGSCGRAIPSYDVRIVDEDDRPVDVGAVGEMVIRPNEPSIMSQGYFGAPDATVAANRNLWFHTGDLARQDEDGWFYYVGRSTDSIRRRGENISAFEVEEVVKLHPDVLDAAAYGVASELTEQDVMVAVVPRSPGRLDPHELVEFCRSRMARHMLPRYVEVVDALPRTPTEKVEKRLLAERGVGPDTWDRDATD
ncbi:MAG: AMP-binding protein [Ilumatobacteraceae bacterium]